MTIKQLLSEAYSKEAMLEIVQVINNDAEKFNVLMDIMFRNEDPISKRAAWAMNHCWEAYPQLIQPYFTDMVNLLDQSVHSSLKRNVQRILQEEDVPENLQGKLLDYSFNLLTNRKETIAVRVFSMSVIHKLSKTYPDISIELVEYLQSEMNQSSAGFRSRAKKIIQKSKKKPASRD